MVEQAREEAQRCYADERMKVREEWQRVQDESAQLETLRLAVAAETMALEEVRNQLRTRIRLAARLASASGVVSAQSGTDRCQPAVYRFAAQPQSIVRLCLSRLALCRSLPFSSHVSPTWPRQTRTRQADARSVSSDSSKTRPCPSATARRPR